LSLGERQALMGHRRAAQTMAYTHTPTQAAIAALERMGDKVKGAIH
jgi:integrase